MALGVIFVAFGGVSRQKEVVSVASFAISMSFGVTPMAFRVFWRHFPDFRCYFDRLRGKSLAISMDLGVRVKAF